MEAYTHVAQTFNQFHGISGSKVIYRVFSHANTVGDICLLGSGLVVQYYLCEMYLIRITAEFHKIEIKYI